MRPLQFQQLNFSLHGLFLEEGLQSLVLGPGMGCWDAGTLAESCCWGLGGRASQLEHPSPGQWPAALPCVPLTQVCGSLDRFLVSLHLGVEL